MVPKNRRQCKGKEIDDGKMVKNDTNGRQGGAPTIILETSNRGINLQKTIMGSHFISLNEDIIAIESSFQNILIKECILQPIIRENLGG